MTMPINNEIVLQDDSQQIAVYESACKAVAEARNVFEAKDIRDKAEAMRIYQKQAKNKQMEIDAAEIRIRAERKIGLLMRQQREAGLLAQGKRTDLGLEKTQVENNKPTLSESGIDKNLADRARKTAAIPENEFEDIVDDWRGRIEEENERVSVNIVAAGERHQKKNVPVSNNSGNNEWYTPPEFIETARLVMGGIDLDPASSEIANQTVKAKTFFTAQQDGLNQDWFGNVWLNPPYAQPLISQFCEKVSGSFARNEIGNAIVLVNNATETAWFNSLVSHASAVFFPKSRIRYFAPDGQRKDAPLQGQAIVLFTNDDNVLNNFFNLFEKNHGGVGLSVWSMAA